MTPFGGGGNRRSARRAAPVQALAVDDLINGGVLGTVVNLSEGGVMLLTDQPLRPGAVFQVALRPLEEVLSAPPLSLGLDCLWSRSSRRPGRYWAGLAIIAMAEADRPQLERLLPPPGPRRSQPRSMS